MSYIINQKHFKVLGNNFYLLFFFRNIHEGYLSLKDIDDEKNKFADKLKNINKGMKLVGKKLFLSKIVLFFTAREKCNFRNRLIPIKSLDSEPKSEPKSDLELEP